MASYTLPIYKVPTPKLHGIIINNLLIPQHTSIINIILYLLLTNYKALMSAL